MDRGVLQQIMSVTTQGGTYSVGNGMFPDCFDKITIEEKSGDMAFIIWYQLWIDGQVKMEINSLHVISVEYFLAPKDGEIPF